MRSKLIELVWLPGPGTAGWSVKFSVNIPCFGDFADPRTVGDLARTAEAAGWDGLFVWDHLVHRFHGDRPFADPWMLLTAAALATSRLRLGTLVTPVARRRPQALAKQVATLDVLSGGRVTLGVGLGRADRRRVRQLRRHHGPGRPGPAAGRGAAAAAGVLVRSAGVARRPALHGRGRDAAAADSAATTGADLGRRLLAEPAADAAGRTVGRRRAAVQGAPARRRAAGEL